MDISISFALEIKLLRSCVFVREIECEKVEVTDSVPAFGRLIQLGLVSVRPEYT